MKKLAINIFMILLLGMAVINRAEAQNYVVVNDGYLLQNGQMIQVNNGRMLPLRNKVVLQDGATVLPNGVIVQQNGVRRNLRDGQAIDAVGQILYPETRQDGSVVLLPTRGTVYERNQYNAQAGGRYKNVPRGNAYGHYKNKEKHNRGNRF